MEILPGVHAVRFRGARGHVLLDDELTLIDTGLPGSAPQLETFLRRHGRSISDLRRIVCTHGHPDHAGAAREMVALASEAETLIHPLDLVRLEITLRDAIRRPSLGSLFAAMTPFPERARPFEDGEIIPVLGGLQVIHTPGHTPGSVCLFLRERGALFVGDALEHRRPNRVTYASRLYSDDYASARRSVARMAALDVQTIVFAHWPPVREGAGEILRDLAHRAIRS